MKTYIPKTTEWMRQNNWGAEAQQLVTDDLTSCEACLAEAEQEVERLREFLKLTADQASNSCWCVTGDRCPAHRAMSYLKPLNSEGRAGK